MGEGKNEKTPVALYFRPAWQTGLTPFDQLYVLLFPPMKMRCDRVPWGYFTRGRDTGGPSSQCEECFFFLIFMRMFSARNVTRLPPTSTILHNDRVWLHETWPSPCSMWWCCVTTVWIYKGLYGKNGNRHYSWNFGIFAIKMTHLNALLSFLLSSRFSARSEAF